MPYNNKYGRDPACDSEPLYRSDPYFIEANANPSVMSRIGTFIDNYSQVCLDVGRLDWLTIRLATRFNSFAGLFFAGDNIQDIITLFTSIIGRPILKPRYVLGYHQGCYGYDTRQKVEDIVDQYRHYGYPIDGMHIDVDTQEDYRIFALDQNSFPDPASMFRKFRCQGIKCSTNATFQGLGQLESRKGKRNFTIGRGNYTGAHRYAGLWTEDNSSAWEFFNISVAQVLSLGLSGVTIAGADVGGFEPADLPSFCDPELFIRWNVAYSLLPWYRNHYVRKGKKLFQEPWAYEEFARGSDWDKMQMPAHDRPLYRAVHPIVRYYIRLRYSLMQLMYDAMYENMLNGLPIARAMIITDPFDGSLFAQNEIYTRSQYLVGHNLLHAPALIPKKSTRKLYLPAPSNWYALNLRAFDDDTNLGAALKGKVAGGTYVHYTASIDALWHRDEDRLIAEQLPYVTPMYVREGE